MNDRLTQSNNKPSRFPEYDNLSGYVVGNYVSYWEDEDGSMYRKTVMVVNLGRPDRGTPADPDAQLKAENTRYVRESRGAT